MPLGCELALNIDDTEKPSAKRAWAAVFDVLPAAEGRDPCFLEYIRHREPTPQRIGHALFHTSPEDLLARLKENAESLLVAGPKPEDQLTLVWDGLSSHETAPVSL